MALALMAAIVVMAGHPATSPAVKLAMPAVLPQAPAAQADAAMMKTFTSATEVQALFAKAKADTVRCKAQRLVRQ